MASSVLSTRQSTFKGAAAKVTVQETGVEWKAVILQDLSNNLIYIKQKTDKGQACTSIAADGVNTRIAEDGDGIEIIGDKFEIAAALATSGDEFSYLAFVL